MQETIAGNKESRPALYTSDLGRATSTAGIIGAACDLPAQPEPLLRERNVGILTGRTFDQIREEYGDIRERYFEAEYVIPEGESLAAVLDRAVRFLSRVAARHPKELVVAISHGAIINTLLRHVLHIPTTAPRSFSFLNCALNRLEHSHNRWKLTVLGDATHLETATKILDEVQ